MGQKMAKRTDYFLSTMPSICSNVMSPTFPSSLMSGLAAMDTKASGRLGVLTVTYYLWTTFIAVIVGIVLVLIIHPGTGSEKDGHHASTGPVMTSADALLDLIRLIHNNTHEYSLHFS